MKRVTLKVRESLWSGRALSQLLPTERELLLPLDGTFTLAFHGEKHICSVVRIEADAIQLASVSNAPALVVDDGGIGPRQMAPLTSLALGQSLKVSTWTLDAGATWEITVERIQS